MQASHSLPRNLPAAPSARAESIPFERRIVGAHMLVALAALSLGILLGPFQTFRRAPALQWDIPVFSYYYQALTVHGVMNALFFTTFFIVGFSYCVVQLSLARPLWSRRTAWWAFGLMLGGLGLVLFAVVTNQANVLYTFYPSLLAHPAFYIGLLGLVSGTWLVAINLFMTYRGWRHDNPGVRVPLAVFGTLANFVMWCVGTIGVTIEIVFMLLPLSLGWITEVNPQLARALFWFFGHPLVYFWLLPAYVSWYTMLPKQSGGRLFSDPLARVSFLLLMIFSVPVGVHHLFTDPGVSMTMKVVHMVFTFVVVIPSMLTAFNLAATLERVGRANGARRPLAWMLRQRWGDPVVAAQLCGMLLFVAGGFSGIIQSSFTLNVALHNTAWVPAHFHMTLAGAVLLTFVSILYWLLPMLSGRALWSRRVALWQVYTWFAGMAVFGHNMGMAGIHGSPRRTDLGGANYINAESVAFLNYAAIGGALLLVSSVLLYLNLIGTLAWSRRAVVEPPPVDLKGDPGAPLWLERWRLWLAVIAVLAVVAWGPVLVGALDPSGASSVPAYRPESPVPLGGETR